MVAPFWGLTGFGLSWLVGQTVVALALLAQGRLAHGNALAAVPADAHEADHGAPLLRWTWGRSVR